MYVSFKEICRSYFEVCDMHNEKYKNGLKKNCLQADLTWFHIWKSCAFFILLSLCCSFVQSLTFQERRGSTKFQRVWQCCQVWNNFEKYKQSSDVWIILETYFSYFYIYVALACKFSRTAGLKRNNKVSENLAILQYFSWSIWNHYEKNRQSSVVFFLLQIH